MDFPNHFFIGYWWNTQVKHLLSLSISSNVKLIQPVHETIKKNT